jgi:hypothetical protein
MLDSITRDLLVAQPPLNIGHGRTLTFVRHDEGANFHSTVYTRLSWIMLLDLPMDYRNEEFLCEAFAKFGKMCGWIRDDPEAARTLVRCAYTGPGDIPRSLVIREPQRYGGTVVSWTVPVYILSSEPADVIPGDESPEPDNGNPHPQFFVGPIPPVGNWVPPVDNQWGEWDAEAGEENVPDHVMEDPNPVQQQVESSITFQLSDASTSSVHFIPANGPIQQIVMQPAVLARVTELIQIEDIDSDSDDFAPEPEQFVAPEPEQFVVDHALVPNPLAIVPYVPPLFITLADKLDGLASQLSEPKIVEVSINLETDKDLSTKRRLDFGSDNVFQDADLIPPLLASTPNKKGAKRAKEVPASEISVRRSTRNFVKKDGYKLEPMRDKVTPKKKPKSAKPRVPKSNATVPPPTPVAIIRKVGEKLEIPAEELTVEKLMADPVQGKKDKVPNE